jgi:molybdenum cofactor cytidylyltransferase
MNLVKALRIRPGDCAAFVGAGGKTSAMFTVARETDGPVVVTTTTHLSVEQTGWGDKRWQPADRQVFEKLQLEILKGGVHVLLGDTPLVERVTGPADDLLDAIHDFCREHAITLLIEADGSKMLPLKAPAAHEPVLPAWVEKVVVCSGLSAVGKPVGDETVHRVELFSKLTGAQAGEPLTMGNIKSELLSDLGGLKSIPAGAVRIALFNQADTPELQSGVQSIAGDLLSVYDAVVISKSKQLDPEGFNHLEAVSTHEKCAGIILAAGKSSRLGEAKQLLDWHGKPFLYHIIQAALRAELDPIIVVTGAEGDRIARALEGFPVRIVPNPEWELGQSTSVRAGIRSLPRGSGSAIYLMSDQPQVEATLIQSLMEKHSCSLAPVVAPLIEGSRGNPVLFDRVTFEDLTALQGDTGGRAVFSKYPIEWLPWSDARMLMDVDTPEDYQKLLQLDRKMAPTLRKKEGIGALILAAGKSTRMGRPKMLLPWQGSTIIRSVVNSYLAAGISEVIVVTGGVRREVEELLADLPVQLVFNPLYENGEMLDSLKIGLRSFSSNVEAAMIALGDQPKIGQAEISQVVEGYIETPAPLVVPSFQMRRGHPWIVERRLWKEMLGLELPRTLRAFLKEQAEMIYYVNIDNSSILMDMDTPEDYERLKAE